MRAHTHTHTNRVLAVVCVLCFLRGRVLANDGILKIRYCITRVHEAERRAHLFIDRAVVCLVFGGVYKHHRARPRGQLLRERGESWAHTTLHCIN